MRVFLLKQIASDYVYKGTPVTSALTDASKPGI